MKKIIRGGLRKEKEGRRMEKEEARKKCRQGLNTRCGQNKNDETIDL